MRRCERRIGELVREGQERGEIAKRGDIGALGGALDAKRGLHLAHPAISAGVNHAQELTPLYALADAPAEQFEQAIGEAKSEGNLSRANVVRKVRGEPAPQGTTEPLEA